MRETTTLENAIAKVHEVSEINFDEVIPIQDLTFESLDRIRIADLTFGVLPSAQRLLTKRMRIPFSYLKRCPIELQSENLNFWIKQESKNREMLLCRFAAHQLRAVFTERYTAIDHMEVLTKMLEYGFDPASEVYLNLDSEMMILKIPDYDRLFRLAKNDKIVPGISIANSEVGILALSIEADFHRIACSNGLITKTAVRSKFKHISRRVIDEFPLVLENVVNQSRHGQDRFRISMETPVDNPINTIETFARQFTLSQNETEVVKQAFYLEQGATMFHVINSFTRAAQEPGLSASDAYRLETTGGCILAMVK